MAAFEYEWQRAPWRLKTAPPGSARVAAVHRARERKGSQNILCSASVVVLSNVVVSNTELVVEI